ncbi:hypothetical protein HPB49_008672 [Dermacentor silvarum]|uniref:Uncharacterized protein n=1 Tax=Dermacentor silvarum TaxID=543639 RepID=A0ACB8CK04_DERSI|nr:hypothetical protein HPB49_008672 [Dermacentor silvarum]
MQSWRAFLVLGTLLLLTVMTNMACAAYRKPPFNGSIFGKRSRGAWHHPTVKHPRFARVRPGNSPSQPSTSRHHHQHHIKAGSQRRPPFSSRVPRHSSLASRETRGAIAAAPVKPAEGPVPVCTRKDGGRELFRIRRSHARHRPHRIGYRAQPRIRSVPAGRLISESDRYELLYVLPHRSLCPTSLIPFSTSGPQRSQVAERRAAGRHASVGFQSSTACTGDALAALLLQAI